MLALEAKEKLLKDLDKTVLKAAVGKSLLTGVKILAGRLKSNLRKTVGARTNRSLSGFSYFGVYNDYLLAQPPADLRKKIMNTNRRTKPGLQRLEEIENIRKEGEEHQHATEDDGETAPLAEPFFQGKPASYWLELEEKNQRLKCRCQGLLQLMQADLGFAGNASAPRLGGF